MNTPRKLQRVADFVKDHPEWTEASVRWLVFKGHENGLVASGAVLRVGRRVFIDPDRFQDWIDSQNQAKQGVG